MNQNSRIMAGRLVHGAIGMVIAIDGNADYGSLYVCTATVKDDTAVNTARSQHCSFSS